MFWVKMLAASFFVVLIALSNGAVVQQPPPPCGYEECPAVKDDMINVHLVPHTHDDVGWLKTVDQYFYGAKTNIQNAGVQYVLDTVIPELVNDPNKRFIYVEIAFFSRWWMEQTVEMKETVKELVDGGRLEFILGGWCMNDEASTHYNAIIDQHALGFEFLRQNFGECGRPRVAWQVDPFGHSREQASLFAQMGYDGLFFGRLDYQDKIQRENTTTMEMLWHGSPDSLKAPADLFTGVLPNMYQPPTGFCFDQLCKDDPIMDDERLHDYNVNEKIGAFVKAVNDQAKHYKTNHIMMTMGSDFQYQNAKHWYVNLDKLIKYTNMLQTTNNTKINVVYSTPSCYLYQLNRAGKAWPTKSDDFFPYASRDHTFWTGYFTSRAALKGYVRETNKFLQSCKQLDALAKLEELHGSPEKIHILKEAMGVAQHHDAVSGTEKQQVAYDYAMRLAYGREQCKEVMNDAMGKLIPKGSQGYPALYFCDLLNISSCQFTEINKEFVLTLYNPVGHDVTRFVRLPVIGSSYLVSGPQQETVMSQIVPVSDQTKKIPERKGSMALYELVFEVFLPALGYSSYFIKKSSKPLKYSHKSKPQPLEKTEDFVMKNQHLSVIFDGKTGMMKQLSSADGSLKMNVSQDIVYYLAQPGNCSKGVFQPSGAYIFRPNKTMPETWKGPSTISSLVGPVVHEIRAQPSPWVSQVTRMYEGANYVELEWTVGPIPINDKWGKEVIARFKTDLRTNKMFYTDANGREILERERDYRATWKLNQTEPVAGNYYPINSRIYIKDTAADKQFTVLTDRSQGGGSIRDGEIEIMLHRRLLYDDCLGCGEPLNETGSDKQGLIVRGKLYFFLDTIANSTQRHREMALQEYMSPLPMFSQTDMKYSEYTQYYHTTWSGLSKPLPANVHMVTLEQWAGPTITPSGRQPYLIRLEHIYEVGEDPKLSQPVTVSLMDLFVPFQVESIEELVLGANLPMSELKRLQWNTENNLEPIYKRANIEEPNAVDVTLNPMQIRTFHVNLKDANPVFKGDKFTVFS